MKLHWDITFEALLRREGLARLDGLFVQELQAADAPLHKRLLSARANPDALDEAAHDALQVELAPHIDDFISTLFDARDDEQKLAPWHNDLLPLYACNRVFIQRRAAKALTLEEAGRIDADAILNLLPFVPEEDEFFELAFAKTVMGWQQNEAEYKSLLEMAARYAAWALHTQAGRTRHAAGMLFTQPGPLDFIQLVPLQVAHHTKQKV